MAKKNSKKVEEVIEEAKDEGVDVEVVETMIDQNGYTWEVDAKGVKIRRI